MTRNRATTDEAYPTHDAPRLTTQTARERLAELSKAHEELLACLDDMEAATRAKTAAESEYSRARWRLSSASRGRRAVVDRIVVDVTPAARSDESLSLTALKADDLERLRETAEHIRLWTGERIEQDWQGYCAASENIRASMRTRQTREQAVLRPILSRIGLIG